MVYAMSNTSFSIQKLVYVSPLTIITSKKIMAGRRQQAQDHMATHTSMYGQTLMNISLTQYSMALSYVFPVQPSSLLNHAGMSLWQLCTENFPRRPPDGSLAAHDVLRDFLAPLAGTSPFGFLGRLGVYRAQALSELRFEIYPVVRVVRYGNPR